MTNNDDDIINKIKNQKEELNKWKNYLASNLSKNIYKKEYLYLIEEEWLRKYQKDIFSEMHFIKNAFIYYFKC